MKLFEIVYYCTRILLPAINLLVYKQVKNLVISRGNKVSLLDVGGRKSHHTISIPAKVTVTDIPRKSDIQSNLYLGVNENIINQLDSRRSNIKDYIIDDMVSTKIPKESFDVVMAVEVLEHVEADKLFINNVYEILKPGGIFFMTTPNGDHVENTNPDHVRHYTKENLYAVLNKKFDIIDLEYAIKENTFYFRSLLPWSFRYPIRTLIAMISSLVNNYQSTYSSNTLYPNNCRHLVAIAVKK